VSTLSLSPADDQLAYVTPGTAADVTAAGWSSTQGPSSAAPHEAQPESVWLAPLDARQPPRRIFQLPSATTPATAASTVDPEHIVDLVWTPDGAQVIAITRQAGPPVRSRIFAMDVGADIEGGSSDARALVLLPAEVLPGSAVPDPGGRWP
jgi:hypothetical protein